MVKIFPLPGRLEAPPDGAPRLTDLNSHRPSTSYLLGRGAAFRNAAQVLLAGLLTMLVAGCATPKTEDQLLQAFQDAQLCLVRQEINEFKKILDENPELATFKRQNHWTLLHRVAIQADEPEFAAALLDRGAQIDAQQKERATPLLLAINAGHPETARLLLERGADPDLAGPEGVTPRQLASSKGMGDVLTPSGSAASASGQPSPRPAPAGSAQSSGSESSELVRCHSNLKILGTALELWAVDHQGSYSTNLDEVVAGLDDMPGVPSCPAAGKPTYVVRLEGEGGYQLWCQGEHHKADGLPPDYPRYSPPEGLIEAP